MHSPPVEWSLAIGHLAVLDYLRSRGDADSDTLSECLRELVERTPHGRAIFALSLVAGAAVFHRHIVRPLG